MSRKLKILAFLSIGVIISFGKYTIVIGQTKGVLVALNKGDASMTIIDPATMKVTAKVPVGNGPHEVVLSPDGKTAYVANYGDGPNPGSTISVIDIATAKELRRVDTLPLIRPHGLQLIGTKLYFTAEANRAIARYDTSANKIDWIMGTGQNGSHMVVGTADQKKFYTANIGSDSVTSIELPPFTPGRPPIAHIPVGKQPEAIDLSPDGKEIWLGLNVEGMVEVVDTAARKSVAKINVGGRPYRVRFTPDGKYVICTMIPTKEVLLIDAATRKEVKRLKLDNVPLGVAFSNDSKTLFITSGRPDPNAEGVDAVVKIDIEKMAVTGSVNPGAAPDGIAVAGV
jgi:YVTN family beta-propeller protein